MTEEDQRRRRIAELEHGFRRAGLPLFVADFRASTDVFNRAVPLLLLVFLAEMLVAIRFDWPLAANVAAALGGLAILLAAIALLNRWRGRPLSAIPERVGRPELAGFVLVPALVAIVFGGQFGVAALTAIGNSLLLVASYAVLGYRLPWILRWAGKRLAGQLAASLTLLTRALPLLLIFVLLAFVNIEMWEVFANVSRPGLVAIGIAFLLLGTGFLIARLPGEVRALEAEVGDDRHPLDRRQRLNVMLVLFVSQALQVLTVAVTIGAFFVAFGAVAITEGVRESWLGDGGNVLVELRAFGERFQITSELLRVAGGLAAFSGLYFAIAMLTDSTYRQEFLTELTAEMRASFKGRAEYLRLREAA